jgi:hypothetical protein
MEDLETRRVRAAKNQSLFREVNEQLKGLGGRPGLFESTVFVCECLDLGCTDTIPIDVGEYERLRRYAARFLVVPGHEDPAVERVVVRAPRYNVVEKVGAAGKVAAAGDPRKTAAG